MRTPCRSTRVLLLALVPLAGCVVTGALDPSGGGHLTLKLHLVSVAHFEQMKARLQSPDVVLRAASLTPKKWATFELDVADVRKLSTAPSLSTTSVMLTDGDEGTRTLAITLKNPAPQHLSESFQNYLGREFKVSIDLPGEVVDSNATATSGQTVMWRWSTDELLPRERTDLTATYKAKRAPG